MGSCGRDPGEGSGRKVRYTAVRHRFRQPKQNRTERPVDDSGRQRTSIAELSASKVRSENDWVAIKFRCNARTCLHGVQS